MNYRQIKKPDTGIKIFVKELENSLRSNTKTIWLICGGSNIGIAVDIMDALRKNVHGQLLQNLTIMETDERYGEVGHKDSNWKQMIDAGFNFNDVKSFPMLVGLSKEETAVKYSKIVRKEFKSAQMIFAQFGMGADGHIAGILPKSSAVNAKEEVVTYDAEPFTRVTLTPRMLLKINTAYAFVFGESKREAVQNLVNKNLSVEEEPCQILKQIPEAYLYSDQIEIK
ncbi:MAG: 6-phosphogluconolactonase [Candidatus Paceibacterota bacterium]|jgi:6-phosphogluconolactonase/glucosamine-6-phosphate isomerase/deaminase